MSGPGMPFVARGKDGAWNPKMGNEHPFFFFGGTEDLLISRKKKGRPKVNICFWLP